MAQRSWKMHFRLHYERITTEFASLSKSYGIKDSNFSLFLRNSLPANVLNFAFKITSLTWRTIRRIVLARKVNCELICIDCFPKTSVLSLAGSELLIRSERYSRSRAVTQRSFLLGCVTIRSQLPRTVIGPLPLKSPPFQGKKVNKPASPDYYSLLNDRLY